MKQHLTPHRRAAALLLAAAALPLTPLAAQDAPVVNAPPPTVTAPPPPLSVSPPPRPVTITPQPAPAPVAVRPLPTVTRAAPAPARPAARTARAAPRAAAPVRQAAPAPVEAAPPPAPIAAAPEPIAAAPPAPAEIAPVAAPAPEPASNLSTLWPWLLAGAALLVAAIAFVALRRRRRAEEEAYYEEPYYEAPAAHDEPVRAEPGFAPAAAPMSAAAEEIAVADADHADVAALNADSEPVPGRPWLEFLMRPVRAGFDGDDAKVEFELTVGNTGSAAASDVRVSTWMVAAGTAGDMEQSLIETPADAQRSEFSIAAGDGARVDGAISLPKEGLRGSVLPVVVADARYTLPDGSEGRTHASFAVGLPSGDGLEPFAIDLPTGMQEGVEARLHGEPERV